MSSFEVFPALETSRLWLREVSVSDASAYLAIYGNANHMRLFGVEPTPDLATAETLIKGTLGSHKLETPTLRWAIEEKRASDLIGNCGLFAWNQKWKECSLGFSLGENWQGKGYMHEALSSAVVGI